jgi:hypothetical protein
MSIAEDIKRAENSHIWAREEHEHYVEPEWCSRRLFHVEQFKGRITDPCCGFGRIPEAAKAAGHYPVRAFDIVDRGYPRCEIRDFLASGDTEENIVGNPPFDDFRAWAEHALRAATSKVALIWLVRTLPAARWLQDTPLARIWWLTPRPSMPPGHVITAGEKPGGGKQDFCWLVWDKQHSGPPTMGWLHRDGAALAAAASTRGET